MKSLVPVLVLASGSRYRQDLLARLGVLFEVIPAGIDETVVADEVPRSAVVRLSVEKAQAVAKIRPGAYVLGSDQMIVKQGRVYKKPEGRARAIEQLSSLQGGRHQLLTSIALICPNGHLHTDLTEFEMEMRSLVPSEIASYVDEEEPFDCAGSYRIEKGGIRLFRAMRGDDYTAIIGLPLTRVHALLEEVGFFG
jgi:septum formation protein